jgi:enoyl-CoA hydratase
MTYEAIVVERTDRIAILRFNRPSKLNSMSEQLKKETLQALEELADDDSVRAVVLTGNGRAFSAGYDLEGETPTEVRELRKAVMSSDVFAHAVWSVPKPLIAAVHGFCLAGACEIAMVCDMTVATESCKFGEPEIRFGVSSTLIMPWVLPMKITKELLMGGSMITAQRAYEVGLVNRVVPDDELMPAAEKLAGLMATMAPAAVQYTKRGINATYELAGMQQAIANHTELLTQMMLADSEEKDTFLELAATQGVRAALNWRDGQFKEYDD